MSKISQLHAELTEQAYDLGFESIEDAERNGYEVDYLNAKLYKPDEQEQAHEAWLKEKEKVLNEQKELHDYLIELGHDALAESVWHAIEFILKGEV